MSVTAPGGTTVRLHRLTMIAEDDGVTVGRPDTGSYAVFPADGAEALRLLGTGVPPSGVAAWYEQTYGSTLDVDDFVATLEDLGFVRAEDEDEPAAEPARWQRLGRWLFSWPAWLCYAVVVTAAVVSMWHDASLRPSYLNIFFTDRISLIPLALTAAQIPCILVHESFHALAGRRLGLPSTLGIGRRLYFLVAETRLNSLLSVPRRQRYMPFLAGMLADAVVLSTLTLLGAALRSWGAPSWLSGLCLAVAFTCVLRLIWQLMFYLETDLYYVVATAMRCADLQSATRFFIRTQFRRLLRRSPPQTDADWTDRDRAMARWYAPLLVAGYAFSLGSLVWAGVPTTVHFWSMAVHRLAGSSTPTDDIVDALIFLSLTAVQIGLLVYVTLRDRRGRTRDTSPQGALA
jgi:hypothetical protein